MKELLKNKIFPCGYRYLNILETKISDLIINEGGQLVLQQGERQPLIGLDDYSVVAEIWQHTDGNHPSDEDDIIRVQDDFGR